MTISPNVMRWELERMIYPGCDCPKCEEARVVLKAMMQERPQVRRLTYCKHCNGWRVPNDCTHCHGTGLVPAEDHP